MLRFASARGGHVTFAAVALALLAASEAPARADVRKLVRLGVMPMALSSDADTPMIGGSIDEAVTGYNAAAGAYDSAHGEAPMATERIDAGDLGIHGALVTIAPGLEIGGEHVYVRIEASLGFGDELRALGLGFYPLNLAVPLRRGTVVPYLSLGGVASWLDRASADGVGALVTARVALGVRLADRLVIEAGYGLYVFGALYDRDQLRSMTDYDPRSAAPPPHPEAAISGGEQHGLIDLSAGMSF